MVGSRELRQANKFAATVSAALSAPVASGSDLFRVWTLPRGTQTRALKRPAEILVSSCKLVQTRQLKIYLYEPDGSGGGGGDAGRRQLRHIK